MYSNIIINISNIGHENFLMKLCIVVQHRTKYLKLQYVSLGGLNVIFHNPSYFSQIHL